MAAQRIWTNERIVKLLLGTKEQRAYVLKQFFSYRRRYLNFLNMESRYYTIARGAELSIYIANHPKADAIWQSLTPANREYLLYALNSVKENLTYINKCTL